MIARSAIVGAAEPFVVFHIGKSARFGTEPDAFRKDAGQEQRVVSDVRTQIKRRPVIRRLQRAQHLEEIIERIGLARQNTSRPFRTRKFRQQLRHVIGNIPVVDPGSAKHMPDQNVEVKTAGDLQASSAFEQSMEQMIVIQDGVSRLFVGEKIDEAFRVSGFFVQNLEDEFDILCSELDPTVRLNHFHRRERH